MANDLFSIAGNIRSTVSFAHITDSIDVRSQAAIRAAENAGVQYVLQETPVDTGALVSTVYSHENQYAAWVGIAGIIGGKPYGYAQENGWHDRGGGFHEGHHMVENAQTVMVEAFRGAYGAGGFATSSVTEDDAYGTEGMSPIFRR